MPPQSSQPQPEIQPAPQQPTVQPALVRKSSARWLAPAVVLVALFGISGAVYAYIQYPQWFEWKSSLTTPSQELTEADLTSLAQDNYLISNIKDEIAIGLKQYFAKHTQYPASLYELISAEGTIDAGPRSLIVLGTDKADQDKFFEGVSYIRSSDARHYVLYVHLKLTKDQHGFVPGGPYGSANADIYGVSCTDVRIYCIADEGTVLPIASASVITTNTDISNWKTYTNEKLGLEFKYPPGFIIETVRGYGLGSQDVVLYNYKSTFEAGYRGGAKETRQLPNFSLYFRVDPAVPDVGTSGRAAFIEKIVIGTVAYERVQTDKSRHSVDYYLKHSSGTGDVMISYSPIIDLVDIGALAAEPDFVAGVEVVKKDPRFLDSADQQPILSAILSTVRLTYVAPPVATKDTVRNLEASMYYGGVAPGQLPTVVFIAWSFDTDKRYLGFSVERKVTGDSYQVIDPQADSMYFDKTAEPGKTYTYRVRASYTDGTHSPYSAETIVSVPAK